jgi:WhiB family redox-sensing transcriptional regulator
VSMKEHRRRAEARLRSNLNGSWWGKMACNAETGHAPPGVLIPDMTAEGRYEQRAAASFCHTHCTVREECLQFAKDTGEENYVWGGTTAAERKHLMKKDRQERQRTP